MNDTGIAASVQVFKAYRNLTLCLFLKKLNTNASIIERFNTKPLAASSAIFKRASQSKGFWLTEPAIMHMVLNCFDHTKLLEKIKDGKQIN